jgi:hypothetical protein
MISAKNYQNNWPQHIDVENEGKRDIKQYNAWAK